MSKKEFTVDEIWEANIAALNNGRKLPYSKKEFTDSIGCNCIGVVLWNRHFPKALQFTKQEYSDTCGFGIKDIVIWNECLPNAEQFTEAEKNNLLSNE